MRFSVTERVSLALCRCLFFRFCLEYWCFLGCLRWGDSILGNKGWKGRNVSYKQGYLFIIFSMDTFGWLNFVTFDYFSKDARLPVQLQRAMAAEAEAAREARAKVNLDSTN